MDGPLALSELLTFKMTSYCQLYCQRRGGLGKDGNSRETRKLLIANSLQFGQKPFEGSRSQVLQHA
jgi:hypothetical protein